MSDLNAETLAEGQSVEAPAAAAAPAPVEGQVESFHSHKWDDGKEDVWNTKEELDDWLRQSGMRHSDYTRKTTDVANLRKKLEQRTKDYEDKERNFNSAYSGIMDKDKFLRENPRVKERIMQEMEGLTGGNSDVKQLLEEGLKPIQEELAGYKQERARRASDEAKSSAYDAVGKRFTDFNRDAIDAAVTRLDETPEGMRLESLVEMIYHAEKGRLTPGAIERKQAMSSNKPRPTTPTASVAIPDAQVSPKTRAEEEAIAIAALTAAQAG